MKQQEAIDQTHKGLLLILEIFPRLIEAQEKLESDFDKQHMNYRIKRLNRLKKQIQEAGAETVGNIVYLLKDKEIIEGQRD